MKKIILLSALAFMFTACGEDSTRGDNRGDTTVTNTAIDSGGGDVTINDVEISGEGTYIQNADGTVTYSTGDGFTSGDIGSGDSDGDGVPDVEVGVYDPAYDASQCRAAGFFFCTLEGRCLDQPASGGTCTTAGVMSIEVY